MKKDIAILIFSLIGFSSYSIAFLFNKSDCFCDYTIVDHIYAIGSTLAFGGILINYAMNLDSKMKLAIISAGAYFVGLSLIFFANSIGDLLFKTYYYVLLNTLITILCFLFLSYRHFRSPK